MANALRSPHNGVDHAFTLVPAIAANNARRIHAALRPSERRKARCGTAVKANRGSAWARHAGLSLDQPSSAWRDYWTTERGRGFGSEGLERRSTIRSRKARIFRGTYLRLT